MNNLYEALSRKFNKQITKTEHQEKSLQGGTVGDVCLVSGVAQTNDGEKLPFELVHKKQKKWERDGHPFSWRCEYDLYQSGLDKLLCGDLHIPACYFAEINEDEISLFIEYVKGVSGADLSIENLEEIAFKWGVFQGKHSYQNDKLRSFSFINDSGYLEREFNAWHTQSFTYDYLITDECPIPEHLKQKLKSGEVKLIPGKSFEYACLRSDCFCIPEHIKEMLTDIDERRSEIFAELKTYPTVLCHGDFWCENIFYKEGNISLIDWDTLHFGFPGEDIACLIVDGMSVERFEENIRRIIPAYIKGLTESGFVYLPSEKLILTMSLIKFGYRMLQEHIFENEPWGLGALEKLYEIRGIN
jgi:thiamine kinase-like enzyme